MVVERCCVCGKYPKIKTKYTYGGCVVTVSCGSLFQLYKNHFSVSCHGEYSFEAEPEAIRKWNRHMMIESSRDRNGDE